MSLRNNKKNVLTTIGAYTSLIENVEPPDDNDTFISLNENKEPLPFLLDTLKVILGSEGIKLLIGELFVNLSQDIEPTLKNVLKKQLIDYNSGDDLSSEFVNNGYRIPIEDIDFFSKLKTDPNSDVGELLYGKTNTDTFDYKVYSAIVNEGGEEYNNLQFEYDQLADDTLIFKPVEEKKIGEWLFDFIDNTTILDKEVFVSNVMNTIFGSITSKQDKSVETINNELKTERILDKIIEKSSEDIDPGDLVINSSELNEIYLRATDLKNGHIRYNMGCDVIFREINLENMGGIVDTIYQSTNPTEVTNVLEETALDNSIIEGEVDQEEVINRNKNAILDGFFQRIINAIKFEIVKALTLTPQILTLIYILNIMKNDDEYERVSPQEHIRNNKNMIVCLIKEILNEINKFIYNLAVVSLMKLLTPVIKKIIKEKIIQYINILRSLLGR